MANFAYLLNTPTAVSDTNALEGEWLEVASGRYLVPAPWFFMFDSGDLGPSTIHYQTWDDDEEDEDDEDYDDDEDEDDVRLCKAQILNPTTSVAEAKLRLERASRMFESTAVDASVVREYWDQVVSELESLPLPYLTIDATEILLMQDTQKSAEEFARAFGSDAAALDLVKRFAGFVEKNASTHGAALGGGFYGAGHSGKRSRTAEARKKWDKELDAIPFEWKIEK